MSCVTSELSIPSLLCRLLESNARPAEERDMCEESEPGVLAPSVSLHFSARSSPSGSARKEITGGRHRLSGALLGCEQEGHPQRGHQRFNLKSVQLAECVCVCVHTDTAALVTAHNNASQSTHMTTFDTSSVHFCTQTGRNCKCCRGNAFSSATGVLVTHTHTRSGAVLYAQADQEPAHKDRKRNPSTQ